MMYEPDFFMCFVPSLLKVQDASSGEGIYWMNLDLIEEEQS